MPTQFRKRPIVVEAVQWTGDNLDEMIAFTGPGGNFRHRPGSYGEQDLTVVYDVLHHTWIGVDIDQWVIKGPRGEFYPIADDILTETYEKVAP